MKSKTFYLTLLLMISIAFASCAGSRSGYGGGYGNHRKGYGCPATSFIQNQPAEKSKI